MNLKIVAAIIVAVFLAGTHWKAYVSGKTAERTVWNLRTIKANDDARELERINRQSKERSIENRTKEILANVAAANRAAESAIGLLNTSERTLQAARENHTACIVAADTHSKILGLCERRLRDVAKAADGHVADLKAVIEAWPR